MRFIMEKQWFTKALAAAVFSSAALSAAYQETHAQPTTSASRPEIVTTTAEGISHKKTYQTSLKNYPLSYGARGLPDAAKNIVGKLEQQPAVVLQRKINESIPVYYTNITIPKGQRVTIAAIPLLNSVTPDHINITSCAVSVTEGTDKTINTTGEWYVDKSTARLTIRQGQKQQPILEARAEGPFQKDLTVDFFSIDNRKIMELNATVPTSITGQTIPEILEGTYKLADNTIG